MVWGLGVKCVGLEGGGRMRSSFDPDLNILSSFWTGCYPDKSLRLGALFRVQGSKFEVGDLEFRVQVLVFGV